MKEPTQPPFLVTFQRSNLKSEARPNETLLETAQRIGVEWHSLCCKGLCGTCKARMISGQVSMDHPFALFQEEKKQNVILGCIAYPLEDVVLDL